MLLLAGGCLGLTMCQHAERARHNEPPRAGSAAAEPAAPSLGPAPRAGTSATAPAPARAARPTADGASAPADRAKAQATQQATQRPHAPPPVRREDLPFAATKAPPGLY